MADLIDQYRAVFEGNLRKSMPAYSAQMISEEVECHLRERCAAAMELGATPETAQLEAIQGFGSAEGLSREFDRQSTVWAIPPRTGNLLMFGLFMIPVVYEYGFLHFDWINLLTVASWALIPALCRKWPIWGTLAGVLVIQTVLMWLPGRASTADLIGIGSLIGFTLVTYMFGLLTRRLIERFRDRRKFPFAKS